MLIALSFYLLDAHAASMTFTTNTSITTNQVINSGETWTVNPGVTLTIVATGSIDNVGGTINNLGTIKLVGAIRSSGAINNEGQLINTDEGYIASNGNFANDGNFINEGRFNNGATFINKGTINNQALGLFENGDRGIIKNFIKIINSGDFENSGTIISGGTINNFATWNNSGTFDISFGGEVDNFGAIHNNNFVGNDGTIENICGGTYSGNAPNGNAVINGNIFLCVSKISVTIKNLPNSFFKSPPLGTKANLTSTLTDIQTMIRANNFQGANDELMQDVRAKMDSCLGASPHNNWITDCNSQLELNHMIAGLTEGLNALI